METRTVNATTAQKSTAKQTPTALQTLLYGIISGIVCAILANIAAVILEAITNVQTAQLHIISITMASLIPNIIGAFLFLLLMKKTKSPVLYYSIIAIALAILDSVNVYFNPPEPDFGVIANPLHFVVAIASIIVLSTLMRRKA